jgi:hypothetical protein
MSVLLLFESAKKMHPYDTCHQDDHLISPPGKGSKQAEITKQFVLFSNPSCMANWLAGRHSRGKHTCKLYTGRDTAKTFVQLTTPRQSWLQPVSRMSSTVEAGLTGEDVEGVVCRGS